MEWVPGAVCILRVRAALGPVGFGICTAHGHKHVDPFDMSDSAWTAACNRRPPHRIVNGWAEWTLPGTAEIERRARSYPTKSSGVVMVFVKTGATDAATGHKHFAWFVNPARQYGSGHRAPRKNIDNRGWESELWAIKKQGRGDRGGWGMQISTGAILAIVKMAVDAIRERRRLRHARKMAEINARIASMGGGGVWAQMINWKRSGKRYSG